jgi:hypothetical protein
MKWNAIVAVGALIAVALVGIVSLNGRSTQAADPPKPAAEVVGRYQLILSPNGGLLGLLDTVTGTFYRAVPNEKDEDKPGTWQIAYQFPAK